LDPLVVKFRAEPMTLQRNRHFWDAGRKWASHEMQMKRSTPRPGESYDEHRQRLRTHTWKLQPELVQAAWFYAIQAKKMPMQVACELENIMEKNQEGDLTSGLTEDLRSRGLLFTFNGNWGMDLPEVVKLRRAKAGPEEMVEVLRQLPYYSALLERFVQECFHNGMKDRGFGNYSAAVEFSMHAQSLGRVHLHLFVSTSRMKYRVNDARTFLLFDKVAPGHVCQTGGVLKGRMRQTQDSIDRAHYYLQFNKRGSLVQRCNWVKHHHFVVKPPWVLQLYKLRKIEQADLVHELIACRCEKLMFLLEGIKNMEKQAFQESEYKRISQIKMLLDVQKHPQKDPLMSEMAWLMQFPNATDASPGPLLHRFKTIVYDGGSQTGKTLRCMEWFPGKTLVSDCLNGRVTSPEIQDWTTGKYKAILFEEANWEMIIKNKLLFQNRGDPAVLQASPTMCNAFQVMLYGVPLMITSNNFLDGIEKLEDIDYIMKNTVYIRVVAQTYSFDPEEQPLQDRSWAVEGFPAHIASRVGLSVPPPIRWTLNCD
jgi:hypothetical protein